MTPLFCPYCDDGPKDISDGGCCGESSAHYVVRGTDDGLKAEAAALLRQLKKMVQAVTGPASVLSHQILESQKLIAKIERPKHD